MLHPLAYTALAHHPGVGWEFTLACWLYGEDDRLRGWALTIQRPSPPAWLAGRGQMMLSWRPRPARPATVPPRGRGSSGRSPRSGPGAVQAPAATPSPDEETQMPSNARRRYRIGIIVATAIGLAFGALLSFAADAHAHRWDRAIASAYGLGLYGNRTACPRPDGSIRYLHRRMSGVAHRTLPCNTRITFRANGRAITVRVIDRGPFSDYRTWDLTERAVQRLGYPTARDWGVRGVDYHHGPVRLSHR